MDVQLSNAVVKTGSQFALLESVVRLGKTMGVQLVAQGVQSNEQIRALNRLGFELAQGPVYSNLVRADAALDMALELVRTTPPAL
jgi:EAL domain-containing protein (putative c-di-GMP-specific phosphodiesterase class I)